MLKLQSNDQAHTYCSVLKINFISKNNKWKIFWIPRRCLYQELISPTIQRLECVRSRNIKNQYAAVGTSVKCHPQGLKSFLSCSVPNLKHTRKQNQCPQQDTTQESSYNHLICDPILEHEISSHLHFSSRVSVILQNHYHHHTIQIW